MNELIEKIQAGLLGVMISDAMGMPVETMKPDEILAATNGQGITTFVDSIQQAIKSQRNLKAGQTTDDWQLTKKVSLSLIENNGFNLEDIVAKHIEAYNESRIGWGSTTKSSVHELLLYQESQGKSGRSPSQPVGPPEKSWRGGGNGVAMKIAPLAIFDALAYKDNDPRYLAGHIKQLTLMTHYCPQALLTAYALALIQSHVLFNQIKTDNQGKSIIDDVIDKIKFAQRHYGYAEDEETLKRLDRLKDLIGYEEAIYHEITPGFLANESVIYSIGIFLTHPTDFRKAIFVAVNHGYDSDTNASMIGCLIGLNCGLGVIPNEWKNFSPTFGESQEIGERLYHAAIKAQG